MTNHYQTYAYSGTVRRMRTCVSKLFSALAFMALGTCPTMAQDHVRINLTNYGATWQFPYFEDAVKYFDFNDSEDSLYIHTVDPDDVNAEGMTVPFSLDDMDSLTFATQPDERGKNKYKVFSMYIYTRDGAEIKTKTDYVDCFVSINGGGEFPDLSASAKIRGRGNSTWEWYDKKPYRLKFDSKTKVFGLKKAKKWVLLANYRDPTDLMNTFAFEAAQWMGMPCTNNTRYVEVFLNGQYNGLYQLTEQIEQGKNRVNVNDIGGFLVNIDLDDGPGLSPNATDNFYSSVYALPIAVKYPDEPTKAQLDSIKADFAILEQAVKDHDYALVDSLMDLDSYISMIQLQEFLYNVDFTAPRSTYMYKDPEGKYTMGPVWDWDAGYDFDWSNMYTGHDFFDSNTKLMLGSNPYNQNGTYKLPKFYTDMFADSLFTARYKKHWADMADGVFTRNWETTMKYVENLRSSGAYKRDASRWPIGKDTDTEIEKMRSWLSGRATLLTKTIAAIPYVHDVPDSTEVVGSINVSKTASYWNGYNQSDQVAVSKSEVARLAGLSETELDNLASSITIVPLNPDGTEGENKTNGTFGGWFDSESKPLYWATGHVYIEVYEDLYNWNYGVRTDWGYCSSGESHTVKMQYRIPVGDVQKAITVNVTVKVN